MHIKLQTQLNIKDCKERLALNAEKITLTSSFRVWNRKKFKYILNNNSVYLEKAFYFKYDPVFNGVFSIKNNSTILEGEIKPFWSTTLSMRIRIFGMLFVVFIVALILSLEIINHLQTRELLSRNLIFGIVGLLILVYFESGLAIQLVKIFPKQTEKQIKEFLFNIFDAKEV